MSRMQPATLTAPAKLNLFLRITGLRDDGYHNLDTLFFRLDEPADVLRVRPAEAGSGLSIKPDMNIPLERNLIYMAWKAFGERTDFTPDLAVDVEKNIPMGAGLGGGSTDAAAMLRYLNDNAGDAALDLEGLIELGTGLGADVPFFLMDAPCRATGIGEKLTPVEVDFSGLRMVLCCPDEHVNTAWAYRAFDEVSLTTRASATTRPVPDFPLTLENDFEAVVLKAFPCLGKIKEKLLALGACAAVLSGSGASIFALFRRENEAHEAAAALQSAGMRTYLKRF